jgi:hypothetical protein
MAAAAARLAGLRSTFAAVLKSADSMRLRCAVTLAHVTAKRKFFDGSTPPLLERGPLTPNRGATDLCVESCIFACQLVPQRGLRKYSRYRHLALRSLEY